MPFYPILTLVLTYILTIVFVFLTAIWITKVVLHWNAVKDEIKHVVIGNFYPLQPISAVILAILYYKQPISFGVPFGDVLLAYGSVLILIIPFYLSYHFFANTTELHNIHGGWFIPPVSTILVTDALLLYKPNVTLFAISLVYFGIGTICFYL